MTRSKNPKDKKSPTKKQTNYCLYDNTLYQEEKKDLYTYWKEVDIPEADDDFTGFTWDGPKIPFSLWEYIVLFHRYSVKKLDSETLNFLFFDPNKNSKQPWQCWVPPQKSQGMTVESNPDHELYSKERKKFHDLQFGTVHNHINMGAFQSGTDESDELDKEGFHITIGKCKSKTIDIHVRAVIDQEQYEINIWDIVEAPAWFSNVPTRYQATLKPEIFSISLDDYDAKSVQKIYDPELKKIEKETFFKKNIQLPLGEEPLHIGKPYKTSIPIHPWATDYGDSVEFDKYWKDFFD